MQRKAFWSKTIGINFHFLFSIRTGLGEICTENADLKSWKVAVHINMKNIFRRVAGKQCLEFYLSKHCCPFLFQPLYFFSGLALWDKGHEPNYEKYSLIKTLKLRRYLCFHCRYAVEDCRLHLQSPCRDGLFSQCWGSETLKFDQIWSIYSDLYPFIIHV